MSVLEVINYSNILTVKICTIFTVNGLMLSYDHELYQFWICQPFFIS